MLAVEVYDLLEKLRKPGCAICALVQRDADRFLDSLLYENVLDLGVQAHFRARRGLCNPHAWQLTTYPGQQLGVALLFQAVLDETMNLMEQPSALSGRRLWNRNSNGDALSPEETCFVCETVAEGENRHLQTFAQSLNQENIQAAYRQSAGLCLPHFRGALPHAEQAGLAQMLREIQGGIWQSLQAELAEFIRKADIHFANEPRGAESDSWRRAVARMVGEMGVFGDDR